MNSSFMFPSCPSLSAGAFATGVLEAPGQPAPTVAENNTDVLTMGGTEEAPRKTSVLFFATGGAVPPSSRAPRFPSPREWLSELLKPDSCLLFPVAHTALHNTEKNTAAYIQQKLYSGLWTTQGPK